jgi:glycogen debranching enzyme
LLEWIDTASAGAAVKPVCLFRALGDFRFKRIWDMTPSLAASHFLLNQLPELYTASERNESNFPVQYIGANVPQAWAAGSVFMLTQALL